MTRETLADRLVNYADAVAAFAVVNSLAFLLALTETEVRCSLSHLLWLVVAGQIVVGLAMTGAVVALRRVELRLRALDAAIAVDILASPAILVPASELASERSDWGRDEASTFF